MRDISKDEKSGSAICIEWMHVWKDEEIYYDDVEGQTCVDHDAWNSKLENTIHRAFQQFADIAFHAGTQGRQLNVKSVHLVITYCPLPNSGDRGQLLVKFTAEERME